MKRHFLKLSLLAITMAGFVQAAVSTTGGPDTSSTVATVDGALMTGGGSATPGLTAGWNWRHNDDTSLYYGADVGVFIDTGTPSFAVIPVMANAYYLFQADSPVHPLLGAMVGPVFSTGGAVSTVRLGLMVRPGVNIELGKSVALNAEARFGILDGAGIFQPQLGVIFGI
jgi:hypothetical protein